MMNREELKVYAEAGVRERLREMQREIEELHREFPTIVANADGTVPSVIPIEAKKGNGKTNGHGTNGHDDTSMFGKNGNRQVIVKRKKKQTVHAGPRTVAAGQRRYESILSVIKTNPGTTANKIAKKIRVTPSAVYTYLKKGEQAGALRRVVGSSTVGGDKWTATDAQDDLRA